MSAIAFIPTDRRHALAHGHSLPEHTHGAALFIDVSGFTPLAEALSRTLGAHHGPEEISRTLNRIYEALIAEVERFGGSVIAFSGDAITCWFDGDDGRRATASALRAQQAMGAFSGLSLASGGVVALGIKAAVAAGPVNRWVVGDPDILLFDTLAGHTLERMAAVEHLAHRGEVVVSSEVFPAIAHTALVTEWRTATDWGLQCPVISGLMSAVPAQPWPPLPTPLTPAQVRPWVVGPIYDRVEGEQNEFLAELRPGVALFVRFAGIDYDHDPAARAKLNAYLVWAQRTVRRYDGHILQLTIGDKGSSLYGAFGAPLAHDDDPKRAVLAAHDLTQLPPEFDFLQPVQVGLAHGRVRAGPYGSRDRRTYGVLGDTVNLAARLMQAAPPGKILVNAALKKDADKRMEWKTLAPLKVKGKAQPVAVFQLERIAAAARRRASGTGMLRAGLVGREAERTRLTNFIDRVRREQRGQLITLEGEAGIGKSRLLEDLGVYARAARFNTLWSTADAVDVATPFHIWRGIFLSLLDWDNHPDDDSRRHAIMSLIGDELDGLAPLVNAVTPPLFEDNELTEHLTGATRANSTREILFLMLQNVARQQPLCLILEDAHWMDSASWQLLDLVQQRLRTAPLALALALRPFTAAPPTEFTLLTQVIAHERILLRPLTADAVAELVALKLGAATLDPMVSALIQRRAEGNPFFSEELALNLRDAGLIHVVDGVARPAATVNLAAASVPDTVQGVVTSRIDRLAPDQQLTLKVASVIGREFAPPPLQAVYPIAEVRPAVPEHLRTLTELSLVTPSADHYQFKHNITHEVAYQLMLFAQRRALHQAMGEWLEHAGQPDEAALAYHWSRAADHVSQLLDPASAREVTTRARQHLTRAGERAMRISAFREAVADLGRALALASTDPPMVQADLRVTLATAYEAQGEFVPALDHLRAAHALAEATHNQPAMTRALNGLGWVLLRQGHYAEARDHLQAALSLARTLHDKPSMALALRRLGVVTARQDRAAAIPFYEESLALYRELQDETGEAACLNNLGNIATREGQFDQAETYYNAGLTLARLHNDWLTIGAFLGNLGEIARRRKQFSTAARHLQDALAIARQIGARENLATNLMNLGEVTAQQGDWAGAEQHYRHALQVARDIGALPRALGALAGLATLQAAHGNYERAVTWATLALNHPASNAEVKDQAEPPLDAARRFLAAAQFEAAQAAAATLTLDTL